MTVFHQLLANNLIASITNFTVWFAVTFWVFLETRSVFATGLIAGIYLVLTGALGIWLGSLVDHHRKKLVMMGSSLASFGFYAVALAAALIVPEAVLTQVAGAPLWLFILAVMFGVIAGNVRNIALPTVVTMLVPADRRDKANGLVGMVTGIGFLTTSAISGFLVAWGGMVATLALALGFSLAAFAHLLLVKLDETLPEATDDAPKRVDLRGTISVVAGIPGLFALIYRFIPDEEIDWKDVWTGAAFTAVLFTVGKFALGWYLGRGSVSSSYGAAGSLVILILWLYYSALIFFFGAEFTEVYARHERGAQTRQEKRESRNLAGSSGERHVPKPEKPQRPARGRPLVSALAAGTGGLLAGLIVGVFAMTVALLRAGIKLFRI